MVEKQYCGDGKINNGEQCDGTNQDCNYMNGEEGINCQCVIPTPTPTWAEQ
ncbi:MAG: hypothetical protein N2482_03255 [Patescibacteria group bacterium]|nr:hypothetical protein [Patescibacteria group bacterium]